jgi:phosphate starvation-inducible PhoH-like protein
MLRNSRHILPLNKVGPPVPRVTLMRGKNKSHHRYNQDLWFVESDDDMAGRSPSSYDDYYYSSSMGSFVSTTAKPKDTLKPRNPNQEKYLKMLESATHPIIIATGPAGCGKSLWACVQGVRMLQKGAINKLVLTRPAVSVDEEHGFLPGTLEQKMDPWIRPLYDVLYKYYTPKQITQLIEKQVIEICPLAFMRGRTFEDSWIILDEAQNTLKNQMLMTLTRIGHGSKLLVTGDPAQHDRGFESNGLVDLIERVQRTSSAQSDIALIQFGDEDIERHPVIQKVLRLYQD